MSEIPLLVCGFGGRDYPFTDNKEGNCAICGTSIVWRPHSPEPSTKVCPKCGMEEVANSKDEVEMVVTKESLDELREVHGDKMFQCFVCRAVYAKGRSDEDALKILQEEYPGTKAEDCETLCDDCFKDYSYWQAQQKEE